MQNMKPALQLHLVSPMLRLCATEVWPLRSLLDHLYGRLPRLFLGPSRREAIYDRGGHLP